MDPKDVKSDTEVREHATAPSPKDEKHAGDHGGDLADYANAPAVVVTEADNKRLFWMINRRILPVMLVTYFCQSLDKGTLNFASIMGIRSDANLVGQQYSWLGTILYMGILAGEYPMNVLLQKLPIAKLLSVNVGIWGIITICSAASTNFGALMAVRFLLGFFESCVQPAMMLLTTMWYKREEQPILNSLWYCMSGVQGMIGGLLAFGVSHYTSGSIKSWQLLFVVLGAFTIVWAILIGIILPDSPISAKCFSEEDKRKMIERVRANETGIENKKYKKYQVIEALKDKFMWACVTLILTANLVIGGLGVFSNLIISNFGFTVLQTQLLNIAQGGVTVSVMVGSAWLCTRFNQTCYVMMAWTVPPIVGTIAILCVRPTPQNSGGMLIAFFCTQFFTAQGNMIISLITRNIAGQTKKGICMAAVFIGWSAGNMTAPQIFQAKDAPRYMHGFLAHIIIYGVYLALVVLTRLLLVRRNNKKITAAEISQEENGSTGVSHELAFADLTDAENPNFRYVF